MITKERLEELIKQRAKIWGIGKSNNVFCVGLKFRTNTLRDTEWYKNKLEVYSKFFETKEDAEEYAEFGSIPRIEWLELPSWEEMQDKLNKEEFVEKYYFYSKHFYKANRDTINIDYTYSIYLMPNGLIIIDDNEKPKTLFSKPLTRENYNEARRICVKLFKGEEI